MIPEDIAKVRNCWASRFPEKAGGGRQALIGFDFQLHSALRDSVAAWLRQPEGRGPLVEALSDIVVPDESGKVTIVQAKLTGRADSVRNALEDLWSVAQTAVDVLADGAADLQFEIRCQRWASSTASSVVDKWQPAQGGDADAVADFKARLRLTTDPSPRAEALELLASGPLRVRDPLGWIDRWTGRLASGISESRDPDNLADELFSDLATLRATRPEDRLSQGIVVLTDKFAPPTEVTPGDYLAGEQPQPADVVNGYFCERAWQVDPAVERFELWLDSVETTGADIGRKLPVYWFEGRSGCGKSVLLLQTLARIRQTNRGMMLWLGNDVEELPEAVAFTLANAEPGDRTIIAIDDGFSPAAQARSGEHWRAAIRALNTARNEGSQLPVIVTCGPTEQRRAFRSAFLDDVEVTAEQVNERLDSDHAADLEQWFTARTNEPPPAHLASSNILMVQRFFQYRTGASIEHFALRFKARLQGMEASSRVPAFIAKLLAVNRLYVGLPPASLHALTDAERDVLAQLTERDNHITVSADSGRGGVWLAHPHLADALFHGWFGEGDEHKAAGFLRDAIIECGLVGQNSAERTAPLTALKLAVGRAHTSTFQGRLDPVLLPRAIADAYETLAQSAVGIGIEDLPAWIRLEQALPGVVLAPAPRILGSTAIKDPSLSTAAWLPTAHALLDTLRPGDPDAEDLLDALRRRISADNESSSGAGAVAARVASFTGDQADLQALARWLDNPQHWTQAGWAVAYRALGSMTQSDSAARVALAWLQSEATIPNPGWGYVLDHKLLWVSERARGRVLEAAVAWLEHPDAATNAAWGHVAQTLLRETQGEGLTRVGRAILRWLNDEHSRRMTTWYHVYRRMLEQVPPSSRRERLQLIEMGKGWLQSPDSFSPGWPIVFDALYSTLEPQEREELLTAATDWVLDESRFSDSNWINVCSGLMRHLGPGEHDRVLALATTWVREPMNQFLPHWDKFLERLIKLVEFTGRDDLVRIGMQWLREWIDQDDARWGSVAQTLMRATDGTDQTDLLVLATRWINLESALEDPLWPVVVTRIVERTRGASQLSVLEAAGRWLEDSVHRAGRGWTRLLSLLADADYDREVLGAWATTRLLGRGRSQDVDDWGDLYALVLGSDLLVDRNALVAAGLEYLRTRSLDDSVDRSQVAGAVLSVLDSNGYAELVRLEMLWLWNQNNWRFPSWNRVFQITIEIAPDQRGELRQLGLQWLRSMPGNAGWGWVLERVYPLTTGQEREQLAAFLWNWFADPVNRDGPAFSKALECAVAMADTPAIDANDVYALGLDWLALGRNFAGRRWSFVFRALGERHDSGHALELVESALTWLSDSRSRADVGWPYVLGAAADLAEPRNFPQLHQLAESWLADPVNWSDQGWGYVAGRASEIPPGLSDPSVAAVGRWLALPLTRRNATWRQCWRPMAPLLDVNVRKAAISTCLEDGWVMSSRLWGFRYLDASGHLDLSAPAIGQLLVEWCSRKRWSKDPVWPHVVALGLAVADTAARDTLTGLAEAWLLEPGNTSSRGTVEAALLGPVEFADLAVSQSRPAIVSNVVDYGAFVNLGRVRGLIHKSEMPNGVADPRSVLRIGQRVIVRVVRVEADTQKVSLSLRAQTPVERRLEAARESIPPLNLDECSPGDYLDGVVASVVDYGAFVDVGGIRGLVHKSEMSQARYVDPRREVRVGQRLRCRVVSVDAAAGKVSLSLLDASKIGDDTTDKTVARATEAEASSPRGRESVEQSADSPPPLELAACSPGDLLDGVVSGVVDFGAFVDVGGVSGLVHKSQIPGSFDPRTSFKIGQRVRCRVVSVDAVKNRLSLSLRAQTSGERNVEEMKEALPRISLEACNEGDLFDGIVTRVVPYGVFVDVGGVSGLLHNNEMEGGGPRRRAAVARPGQRIRVRVRRVDREAGRIDFSIRNLTTGSSDAADSP